MRDIMDIMTLFKLLYKIILISPVLLTITYLILAIYNFKQGNRDPFDYLIRFLYGAGALVSYGITAALFNKSSKDHGYTIIDKIGMPIMLILYALLYVYIIGDEEKSLKTKLTILVSLPCLPGLMLLIEKIAESLY